MTSLPNAPNPVYKLRGRYTALRFLKAGVIIFFESSTMADGGRNNFHGQECNCCRRNAYGVEQSMEEMDFHRSLGSACMTGDLQRMERLISKGADVNAEDSSGYSPLHYASRNGHVQACSLLLKNGALVNKKTRGGQATSLHRAAYAGHEKVVKILIDAGADLCVQDSDGCTALHKAVFQGHHGIVNLLMNASTKISEIQDNQGRLPRDC